MRSAAKKYTTRLTIALIIYFVALIGGQQLISSFELSSTFEIVLALLPSLPVIMVVRAVLEFSKSWDELQRQKSLEATLIAFIVVGLGTFSYGFLEGLGFPKISMIWVFPMLYVTHGVAMVYVTSKYQ
jgi:hypothetical protein